MQLWLSLGCPSPVRYKHLIFKINIYKLTFKWENFRNKCITIVRELCKEKRDFKLAKAD